MPFPSGPEFHRDDWLDCAKLQRAILWSSGRRADKVRVTEAVGFGNVGKLCSVSF
jgi:hypothetical protein